MKTAFEKQLAINIRETIIRQKRDGCTAMGMDNLKQVTRPPSADLDGAPRGTNAQYYYAEMFRNVARETAAGFLMGE